MNRIAWSLGASLAVGLSASTGCAPTTSPGPPAAEAKVEKMAIDALPAGVREAAEKHEPGVDFQWAEKRWEDGVLVYKLQGESGEGKIHEVEVNASGEVLAPGGGGGDK
jgi:hypothetical protein